MDKGYDSEAIHRLIREDLHANSVIPIRSWNNEIIGGTYRQEMACQFNDCIYPRRQLVENKFSVLKRKFSGDLKSRRFLIQTKEIANKMIVCNIHRFLQFLRVKVFYRALFLAFIFGMIGGLKTANNQPALVITPIPTTPAPSYTAPVSISTTQPPQRDGKVTIEANKDSIIIGQPISFSGTCIQGNTIGLSVAGPGLSSNGELLAAGPCQSNIWSYQWSTVYSLQPGSYQVVVVDAQQNTYDYTTFTAQKGTVTMVGSTNLQHPDMVTVSGTDTAGRNIEILAQTPESQSKWVIIHYGIPVQSDNTWSNTFSINDIFPGGWGSYTIEALDTTSNQYAQVAISVT